MEHRHLDYPRGTPIGELGAAALDDLLERGDLESWAPLARAVRSDPRGTLAETVLRICAAHPMYGTSALWRSWIERLRAGAARHVVAEAQSLRTLRRARGLTQQDVAHRLGIAQSDVSKLERRSDLRLSTLCAYVAALDGCLELRVRFGNDDSEALLDLEAATRGAGGRGRRGRR